MDPIKMGVDYQSVVISTDTLRKRPPVDDAVGWVGVLGIGTWSESGFANWRTHTVVRARRKF